MGRWPSMPTAEEAFDSRVVKTADCWEYVGAKGPFGYGSVHWRGKTTLAHRVMWIRTFGEISAGMCVLHRCDNPPCVNPEHLFLGTRADNTHDMWAKGRQRGSPALNAAKAGCPKHQVPFKVYRSGRRCVACIREDSRARRAALSAEQVSA